MLKMITILLAEKSVRLYLRFFAIGMGISFATLILNSSFRFMGVDLSEFKSLFLSILPLFLKDYIQILIASGILFGAIGLLLSSVQLGNEKEVSTDSFFIDPLSEDGALSAQGFDSFVGKNIEVEKENSYRKVFWTFGVFVFLLWCHSVIFYPQLYGEFFFYRFSFLRFFLFFLTDWVSPWIPSAIALGILGACIVKHSFFLILKRNWFGFIFFVLFCFLLFWFHSCGSLLGILSATIFYLSARVFESSPIFDLIRIVTLKNVSRNRIVLVLLFIICTSLICFAFSKSRFGVFALAPSQSEKVPENIAPSAEGVPNILILSADSLRYDKMGYAQGKEGLTPHIDLLAKDSVIFQDHHTTIPRTFPAWADLLTGQPSFIHGIQDMFPDIKDREGLNGNVSKTLPNILSQLGYKTHVVSSFAGDIFPRADWGFQSVNAPMFHAETLTAQRILETQIFLLPILTGSIPGAGEYFGAIRGFPSLGDDSKILPDLLAGLKKEEGPFFTVFFSSVTHFPFSPPYPYYKIFTNSEYYGKFKYFKFVNPSDSSELSNDDREQIRGLFQASIYSFDNSVGKILEHLKKEGIYDSTLIVLTSDHGESLFEADHSHGHGEHLRGEGVTHIPLLVKFPRNVGAGRRFTGISSSLDLFPTLLSFVSDRIQDFSLRENLRNELKNRFGRDLSAGLSFQTWKDSRNVYGETGIWFSDLGDHFYQKERIYYPDILHLHSIESGEFPFISIGDSYAKESVIISKHRMFQNTARKLIYIPSENGVFWRCYDRIADPWNERPLAIEECSSLKDSLISFLVSSGKFKKAGEYLLPLSN
ncbi:sulfatase family protein [Leptospira borgpetersenii]|uniref:sulfatase family protein n=1 Tax=Leptospira borgpetersenii TaxID=174 RepID=UPI00187E9A85|nr:sulfatase-like hydrolase/transferase [Leptospira borgpetersenii]MBE8434183.1 sulfatase-like hydrolase/transferase [Leptospira borgpetersenii serovar Tarassovi]UVA63684.1 sulfatase-like hydrolase/transferase [Leptospira borgpetersenii]